MTFIAKTLIDTLRKTAEDFGISSSLSKDRDRFARLLFGRPYSSVIAAEKAGSLAAPALCEPHAATLIEKHGERAQGLLKAAALLVRQAIDGSFPTDPRQRPPGALNRRPQVANEASPLRPVEIAIDFIVCKGNGVLSDAFFARIKDRAATRGYAVQATFVDRGGDTLNPIARIRTGEPDAKQVITEIQTLAHEELFDLIMESTPTTSTVQRGHVRRAFDDEAIDSWRMLDVRTYVFSLKGIATPIRLVLTPSRSGRGGYDFRVSHIVKTPTQAGPYQPGIPWGDDLGWALHQAITSVTTWYRHAVDEGFAPSKEWLLPNPA